VRKFFGLIVVAVLAFAGWLAWALLTPVGPPGKTFVMLHPGFSTYRIASELKSAGVIRSEKAFVLWHYFHHGRSLKAGEYLFENPANIIDLQKRLRRGDVYFRTVVVPEGFTMFDIARAVEAAGLGIGEQGDELGSLILDFHHALAKGRLGVNGRILGVGSKPDAQADRRPLRRFSVKIFELWLDLVALAAKRIDPKVKRRAARQRGTLGRAVVAEDAGEIRIEPFRIIALYGGGRANETTGRERCQLGGSERRWRKPR